MDVSPSIFRRNCRVIRGLSKFGLGRDVARIENAAASSCGSGHFGANHGPAVDFHLPVVRDTARVSEHKRPVDHDGPLVWHQHGFGRSFGHGGTKTFAGRIPLTGGGSSWVRRSMLC